MDAWTETLTVGGQSMGCIGAKRQSDHQTVSESHYFLFDGFGNQIRWSSCDAAPALGSTQYQFTYGMWEHEFVTDPGYSPAGLPDPHSNSEAPRAIRRGTTGARTGAIYR